MSERDPSTARRSVTGDGATSEGRPEVGGDQATEPVVDTLFTSSDVPRARAPAAVGSEGPSDEPRGGGASFLRELPVLVLIAFVLAFLLRTFVVQVFYIPSSSMEPTLQVNDRILVDKVTYRFRDLRRGEIVVFEGEHVMSVEDGPAGNVVRGLGQLVGVTPADARDFVKRVVGLPGDELYIDEEGTVVVNGEPLEEPYLGQRDPRTCGPLVVPEGHLFFLGDNRANSSDSRASLGLVAAEHVVGRAFVTIWPLERVELLETPTYLGVSPPPADAPPPEAASADGDICEAG